MSSNFCNIIFISNYYSTLWLLIIFSMFSTLSATFIISYFIIFFTSCFSPLFWYFKFSRLYRSYLNKCTWSSISYSRNKHSCANSVGLSPWWQPCLKKFSMSKSSSSSLWWWSSLYGSDSWIFPLFLSWSTMVTSSWTLLFLGSPFSFSNNLYLFFLSFWYVIG